jgi:hypothetical protein
MWQTMPRSAICTGPDALSGRFGWASVNSAGVHTGFGQNKLRNGIAFELRDAGEETPLLVRQISAAACSSTYGDLVDAEHPVTFLARHREGLNLLCP